MSSNTDDDKSAWFREHIAMETDGERTPIQTDPDPVVFDERTPAFLRRQA